MCFSWNSKKPHYYNALCKKTTPLLQMRTYQKWSLDGKLQSQKNCKTKITKTHDKMKSRKRGKTFQRLHFCSSRISNRGKKQKFFVSKQGKKCTKKSKNLQKTIEKKLTKNASHPPLLHQEKNTKNTNANIVSCQRKKISKKGLWNFFSNFVSHLQKQAWKNKHFDLPLKFKDKKMAVPNIRDWD